MGEKAHPNEYELKSNRKQQLDSNAPTNNATIQMQAKRGRTDGRTDGEERRGRKAHSVSRIVVE